MKINKSENEIQALFQEKFETRLEKIPESHEKTPDFFGFKNNKKIFVAELKEIENIFLMKKMITATKKMNCSVAGQKKTILRRKLVG